MISVGLQQYCSWLKAPVLLLAEGTIGLGFHARIASVKMQEKTWYIDHVVPMFDSSSLTAAV